MRKSFQTFGEQNEKNKRQNKHRTKVKIAKHYNFHLCNYLFAKLRRNERVKQFIIMK